MKLSFKSPHISIQGFDPVELPQLTVLTGLNGAGKTHLLESLVKGTSALGDIPKERVKYYDLLSFRAKDDKPMPSAQIIQQQQQAWQFFIAPNNRVNAPNVSLPYFDECFTQNHDDQLINLWEAESENDPQLWKEEVKGNPEFKVARKKYTDLIDAGIFQNQHFRGHPHARGITKAIKSINKPLHLISESDFNEHFVLTGAVNDHLSISISSIFTQYKTRQLEWGVARLHHKPDDLVSASSLKLDYERRFPKPWDTINEIIKNIHVAGGKENVFDFSITDPDADVVTMSNHLTYQFQAHLKDNKTGVPRNFDQLSSGEKVLLALTLTIFEAENGNEFPALVLLDEVDASLHPSMTYALLQTLKTAFVENGVQVILATHSPSTIAMSDEACLFSISRDDSCHKITKETSRSAMDIVSEGFATLENGMALFNDVAQHPITIITEGHNADILQRACQLYGHDDVHVVGCFRGKSGKDQLRTLFQFFCQAAHERPVLFVLDCDVPNRPDESNNYWLALPENKANNLAAKGIENIFLEEHLEPYVETTIDSHGAETKKFDDKRKRDFANHVVKNGTKDTYAVFTPMFEILDEIRANLVSELEAEAEAVEPSETI